MDDRGCAKKVTENKLEGKTDKVTSDLWEVEERDCKKKTKNWK